MWLLASAGVQSASLQFNKAAQFRTQAVYFATDIAERMQANKTGATAGNYAYSRPGRRHADRTARRRPARRPISRRSISPNGATGSTRRCRARTVTVTPVTVGNPVTYKIVVSWVDRRTDRTYSTTGSTESFSYTATKTVFDSSTL